MKKLFFSFLLWGSTLFALTPKEQADAEYLAKEVSRIMRQIDFRQGFVLDVFLSSFCKNPENFNFPDVFLEELNEFCNSGIGPNPKPKILLCSCKSDEEEEKKRADNVINGAVDILDGGALMLCPHPIAQGAGIALAISGSNKVRDNLPITRDKDEEEERIAPYVTTPSPLGEGVVNEF